MRKAGETLKSGSLRKSLADLSNELKQCVSFIEDFGKSLTSESVDYKRKINALFNQKSGALASANSRLTLSEKNVEALRSEAIAVRQLLEASERARAALEQTLKRGAETDSSVGLQLKRSMNVSPGFVDSRSSSHPIQLNGAYGEVVEDRAHLYICRQRQNVLIDTAKEI